MLKIKINGWKICAGGGPSVIHWEDRFPCAKERTSIFISVILKFLGEVAEWFKAAVLKTVDPHGSGGSNPSLSATLKHTGRICSPYFLKWLKAWRENPWVRQISRS